MKTSATNRRLRVLLTAIRNESLIPRPDFQRRLVWSNKNKVSFIETVLADYPFPEVYVAAHTMNSDTGESTEMLVDGQQRITTLFQYFSGSEELKLGNLPAYGALSPEAKIRFLEYEVVVRDLGSESLERVKEIFRRINSTDYALNAMEMHNARYEGALKKFIDEISEWDFFENHRVFSANDLKRMNDLRFVLTLVATIMSTYFHRDEALEPFLARYNDEFPEAGILRKQLRSLLETVDSLGLQPDSRVWKKGDLFTLLVELYRAHIRDGFSLSVTALSEALKAFYAEIDSPDDAEVVSTTSVDYRFASIQASNDRSSRMRRGEIVASVIYNSQHPSTQERLFDEG